MSVSDLAFPVFSLSLMPVRLSPRVLVSLQHTSLPLLQRHSSPPVATHGPWEGVTRRTSLVLFANTEAGHSQSHSQILFFSQGHLQVLDLPSVSQKTWSSHRVTHRCPVFAMVTQRFLVFPHGHSQVPGPSPGALSLEPFLGFLKSSSLSPELPTGPGTSSE